MRPGRRCASLTSLRASAQVACSRRDASRHSMARSATLSCRKAAPPGPRQRWVSKDLPPGDMRSKPKKPPRAERRMIRCFRGDQTRVSKLNFRTRGCGRNRASGVPRALFFGGANEEHLTRACFRWREWGRPQARTALEEIRTRGLLPVGARQGSGVPAPFNNRGDGACPRKVCSGFRARACAKWMSGVVAECRGLRC